MAFEANFSKPFPAAAEGRKKVLIIVSHPNVGKSFNHTLVEAGKKALEEEGHAVIVDDLVKIGWNPVGSEKDFIPGKLKHTDNFDYQTEQGHAPMSQEPSHQTCRSSSTWWIGATSSSTSSPYIGGPSPPSTRGGSTDAWCGTTPTRRTSPSGWESSG